MAYLYGVLLQYIYFKSTVVATFQPPSQQITPCTSAEKLFGDDGTGLRLRRRPVPRLLCS